jgi:hypothetical protein
MAHGIEHGFRSTFWSGTPEPAFLHLGPRGTYDTEPETLAEQNLAADEKRRQEAAEQVSEVLPTQDLVDFAD